MKIELLPELFVLILFPAFFCWGLISLLKKILPADYLVAQIQNRSNHELQAQQLGGLALVPVSLICSIAFSLYVGDLTSTVWGLVFVSMLIFICGWRDDVKTLGMGIRLITQFIVASVFVYFLTPSELPTIIPFSRFLLMAIVIIFIIYWINITNFMDGIDLMAVVGVGIPLLFVSSWLMLLGNQHWITIIGIITAGALFGFGFHNRPPASIFLGDSGSLFCGLISSGIIYQAAFVISPAVAILPFSYFLMDSGITLLLRLTKGENIFQSHSRHAYQIAFRRNKSAKRICGKVFILSVMLCLLSIGSILYSAAIWQFVIVGVGFILTGLLIQHFRTNRSS